MVETIKIVNKDTEDEFSIEGYQESLSRTILFYFLGCISAGFVFLIGYWLPEKRTKFTHVLCALEEATTVIAVQGHGKARASFICEIITEELKENSSSLNFDENDFVQFELDILKSRKMRYFRHMFLRYYFTKNGDVKEISGLDCQVNPQQLNKMRDGIHVDSWNAKRIIHGENLIEVPNKPFLLIFIQFAADPLYCFQFVSVVAWYVDDYIYYTTVIILMTLFSLIITSIETRRQVKKFHDMIGKPIPVQTFHQGDHNNCKEPFTKLSNELVPGDVFLIPKEGLEMPCDAILIDGACVVDESSLTGEGFPVSKTHLEDIHIIENVNKKTLNIKDIKHHALFYGTKTLQAHSASKEQHVKAMVLRTGFTTLKGRLIRSIIFPKPIYFKFFRDSMKFILFLGCLGIIGIIYSMTMFALDGSDAFTVIKRGFDVITIIVPPVLPACMSIGLLFAVRRLKRREIFCTDPQRVNLCGKLKLFVFDKTGTLTNDKLAVSGVIPVKESVLQNMEKNVDHMSSNRILKGMACCHSLSFVDNSFVGNPLDCYMFESTKWSLKISESSNGLYVESPTLSSRIEIIKEFPFSSSLQRMSVIVKELESEFLRVYMKGSPESVISFCEKDSHPSNFNEILLSHTQRGHRVLAMASKVVDEGTDAQSRNSVESDLEFLGLIIFENQIKQSTKETINLLQSGNIRTVMATGDNLYTAAAVAREVNMIKSTQSTVEISTRNNEVVAHILPLSPDEKMHSMEALEDTGNLGCSTHVIINEDEIFHDEGLSYSCILTGKTYLEIKQKHPLLVPKLLMSASVYARMSPNDKSILIEDLKTLGYGVGMCGDGANDCGALKAAHAGIALSDSEASVAAPFTSRVFEISCVPWLIREGRAALVTSFNIFMYLAAYSFIQFFGVLILYSLRSSYSDWEYTYADLALCLLLSLAMIQSGSVMKIATRRPPGRLVHPIILLGFLVQTLIILGFQIVAYFLPTFMPWYKPVSEFNNANLKLNFICYENYSLITISFFQYIWLSVVFSTEKPYRVPLYKNYWYVGAFAFTVLLTLFVTVIPGDFISQEVFLFPELPSYTYRFALIILSLVHFYFAYVIDRYIIRSHRMKVFCNKVRGKVQPKNRYKHVYKSLLNDSSWPPYERS